MIHYKNNINNIEILVGENDHIEFQLAPVLGGKILSIVNKDLQKEFLWNNKNLPLEITKPGADYNSNFWGGIDELIPNDIPEKIDSISYPDHGELWTTQLQYDCHDDKISVYGKLQLSNLFYKKTMYLAEDLPVIYLEYKIKNESDTTRNFLWKLHAALVIEEGDRLITSAKKAKIVYPKTSRFNNPEEFNWPKIESSDVSIVSPVNGTLDFFYLYDIQHSEMTLMDGQTNHLFRYSYDKDIFPYQWYFASYGDFLNHHVAILEPATGMPVSVSEASALGQCSRLKPGQEINTVVCIYAGQNKNYFK